MPTRSFMSWFIIHLPCLCRGVIAALVFCFLISSVQCFHLPFLWSPYRALGWYGHWLLEISGGCDKSEWDTNIKTAQIKWLSEFKSYGWWDLVSGRPLNLWIPESQKMLKWEIAQLLRWFGFASLLQFSGLAELGCITWRRSGVHGAWQASNV